MAILNQRGIAPASTNIQRRLMIDRKDTLSLKAE